MVHLFETALRGRPDNPVRFTDGTSLDSRLTQRQRVPVYATVPQDSPIDWYYDLVAHLPDAPGEVKSSQILAGFDSLPEHVRSRVWKGLRPVLIHVSDPRPYLDFFDNSFREAIGDAFPEQELLVRTRGGDPMAKHLLEERERLSGELMLSESVELRLQELIDSASHRSIIGGPDHDDSFELRVDEFKSRGASMLRLLAEHTAKGSAAFIEAYEKGRTYGDEVHWRQFWAGPDSLDLIHRGTLKALEDGHAFDQGDTKAIERLERERRSMVRHLVRTSFYGLDQYANVSDTAAFIELDSRADTRIQAADAAAGLARAVFTRHGLVGVIRRWDSVYYNGSRVTENNLETALRLWSRM